MHHGLFGICVYVESQRSPTRAMRHTHWVLSPAAQTAIHTHGMVSYPFEATPPNQSGKQLNLDSFQLKQPRCAAIVNGLVD